MALLDRFAGPHEAYRVGFYRGDDHDFDVRILLGMAAYGATEPGEVLATIADVSDGDHQGWFDAWNDLGRRLTVAAEAAAAAGHSESASRLHLRAASYLGTALHGVDALADQSVLLPVFRAQQAAWNAFIDTTSVTTERLSIPLGDITIPAVLFSPSGDDGARRPTLVMVNGSDGATSDLWASGLAGGLARGYRVLVFDGPGQQTLLFEQGIPFRPDWEAVVTPIVDLLLDRSDVDPERLALYGISQAGYWVPRTLAFEHRFAAAIADPGVVDVSESWLSHFPKSLVSLLDRGEKERFDHEMELGMRVRRRPRRQLVVPCPPVRHAGLLRHDDRGAEVHDHGRAGRADHHTAPDHLTRTGAVLARAVRAARPAHADGVDPLPLHQR